MQTGKLFAVATTVLGLLAASCGLGASPTAKPAEVAPKLETRVAKPTTAPAAPSPTAKPAADQPRYGGILTRAMDADLDHFDLQQAQAANFSQILFNVYQGLVRLHPIEHQKIVPELAEKWEISPDGKTYTFKFYKDIRWHDGKPFTVEDVKYSLQRIHRPREFKTVSPRGEALLTAMDSVETIGEDTIRLNTLYPSASFLLNLATGWIGIGPKHILLAKGDMRRDAIGTGPFKLKESNAGVSVELTKNANHFDKGVPHLDGIKFYVVRDGGTRFSAFRTGQVRMTFIGSKGLSDTEAEIVKREMVDQAVVYDHDSQARFTLAFNFQRSPWNDVRVRKAVDLAFDHQAAIKVGGNRGHIGSIYPQPWGMKPDELAKLPGYRSPKDADIAEARRLMAEAGFAGGLKTTLLFRAAEPNVRQAEVTRDQLAKIGINAELVVLQQAALEDRMARRAFDLVCINWTANTSDPDETLYTYYASGGSRNYGGFSDKMMDELIDKQARTLDKKEREVLLAQIERRSTDLVPMLILFWDLYQMGAWKEVKGFKPGPGVHPWGKFDRVWLAK
ncbi:MAG: ABC transporter substrate-binding protein [Chloroflexi bacterium]|nr:ABC transporter substrate-binding protein [Chloroflexota bacterium]